MTKKLEPNFKTRKARKQKMALRGNTLYTHQSNQPHKMGAIEKIISDFSRLMHRRGDR